MTMREITELTEKHPHGRGEDLDNAKDNKLLMETPPRAWGRRAITMRKVANYRNTPTGVGKTICNGYR